MIPTTALTLYLDAMLSCSELKTDPSNLRDWTGPWMDILGLRHRNGDALEKFAWDPETATFFAVYPGRHHDSLDLQPFENYLRGIVLHRLKAVCFRPCFPTWMPQQCSAEVKTAVSQVIQHQAMKLIQTCCSSGWEFVYDVNNERLRELSQEPNRNW